MERFVNGQSECVVLMRTGDTALIVIPAHTCQPYVVPWSHHVGENSWQGGNYFESLPAALDYYHEQAK